MKKASHGVNLTTIALVVLVMAVSALFNAANGDLSENYDEATVAKESTKQ
ncbi:hypothetical protein [Catenovulum maritimum]|nr:hypothetical protein [Catenovulum maritimum]